MTAYFDPSRILSFIEHDICNISERLQVNCKQYTSLVMLRRCFEGIAIIYLLHIPFGVMVELLSLLCLLLSR
jgi:hypothetical protein